MINIAIIDDERKERELLTEYSKRFAEESGIAFNIKCVDSSLAFLNKYQSDYDLILLDIEMPELNGMELAARLRAIDTRVAIIFVTNMAQYAVRGYQVDAADFIVKPLSYYDFAMKVGRVVRRIQKRDVAAITVYTDGSVKRVAIENIRYVDVQGHILVYHTVDGEMSERGTLKNAEENLSGYGFAKCNNYCLVNLKFVTSVKDFTLFVAVGHSDQAEPIVISHPRKKDFIKTLGEYWRKNI